MQRAPASRSFFLSLEKFSYQRYEPSTGTLDSTVQSVEEMHSMEQVGRTMTS